ncbi:MAG TPA: C25 family cysteine peptidase [Balneolales bacterium]|nr:C25 family cysteine peptidase [Balneolales bacterium]
MNIKTHPESNGVHGEIKIEFTFDSSTLNITESPFGMLVELEGCHPSGEFGGPSLPSKSVRLALPPSTKIMDLETKILKSETVLDGPVLIAPLQPARPGPKKSPGKSDPKKNQSGKEAGFQSFIPRLREEPFAESPKPTDFVPVRQDLYELEMAKPRPTIRQIESEEMGLNPIVTLEINPLRFTKKGGIELSTQIQLIVRYQPVLSVKRTTEDTAGRQKMIPPAFPNHVSTRTQAERLSELTRISVINPEWVVDISDLLAPVVTHAEYLIITDNYRWDPVAVTKTGTVNGNMIAEFQRLADWKAKRGLTTHVATISNIVGGAYGDFRTGARDLQEIIRNFLKFAHAQWGTTWLALGGDIDVVPIREIIGFADGSIGKSSNNPPNMNQSFWTGTFLKMQSAGHSLNDPLLNAENGLAIPYDPTGSSGSSQRGWYFTTSNSYTTRSSVATNYIRVNGPAAEVNGTILWVSEANRIPTDLYYSSLIGVNYDIPGKHDWDLIDNGFYGTHNDNADMDGVAYKTDISVGRVSADSASQAKTFVDKVISYESFRRPDGVQLNDTWTRKLLIGAANWGGRVGIWPTGANPPGDNQFYHASGSNHSLIRLRDAFTTLDWRLLVQVTETDIRIMPYSRSASGSSKGWHYAKSQTDLSTSEQTISIFGATFHIPIPTNWVVVYGPPAELAPQVFVFDLTQVDGSLHDQEQLREQITSDLQAVNNVYRLYEDDVDMTPAEKAAAPYEHLTEQRMFDKINEGPHFVSLSGHGWWGGCCGYSLNTAQNATNGFHTYIAYADSCSTNEFDVEDAVSEKSLYNPNGGAIAYIGNTRFSWIGVGDNFQRAFFHRLTSTRHLGLLNDVRCTMVNENTGFWKRYNKWAIFALNLMGDPEMPVWVGPPNDMYVELNQNLDKRYPFEVQVKHRAFLGILFPLAGAHVTVVQGSFIRHAKTDANGRVSFDINNAQLGNMEVTVTKINYRPVIETVEIVGPAWVTGMVNVISHMHQSSNDTYIRLNLATSLNGSTMRGWYAQKAKPDYGIILDAATDAYISQKQIHFMVTSIKEGGTIEKFRFGIFEIKPPIHLAAEVTKTVAELPKAEPVTRLTENIPATEETPAEPEEQVMFEPVKEPVMETKSDN